MTLRHRFAGLFIVAATIGLAVPGAAAANDNDKRERSRPTRSASPASRNSRRRRRTSSAVPGACARKDDDDDSNSQSLDQMVAKLNAMPGAQAAIQSAGMTTREYVVFMWSRCCRTGMAAWALKQPGGKLPPGVSQANVDFYKKHEAAMTAIGENDPCRRDEETEE